MASVTVLGLPWVVWLPWLGWASRDHAGFRYRHGLAVASLAFAGGLGKPV